VAAACPVAVALWLTASRGAVLAALAGSVALVALRRGRGRELLCAAVALAAVGALVLTLVGSPRATLGDRAAYWDVAVEGAAAHPVLGSGAGSFDDYWLEHRPIPTNVRDAHSLYLETAAELGVVGLVLLLVALVAPLTALARARDARAVSAAAAAYAAFLVHAGLDWDWEMPVTTVAGLACGAAVLVGARRG
jgi:O-antigen ligase